MNRRGFLRGLVGAGALSVMGMAAIIEGRPLIDLEDGQWHQITVVKPMDSPLETYVDGTREVDLDLINHQIVTRLENTRRMVEDGNGYTSTWSVQFNDDLGQYRGIMPLHEWTVDELEAPEWTS